MPITFWYIQKGSELCAITSTVAGLQKNSVIGAMIEVDKERSVIRFEYLREIQRGDRSDGKNVALHRIIFT